MSKKEIIWTSVTIISTIVEIAFISYIFGLNGKYLDMEDYIQMMILYIPTWLSGYGIKRFTEKIEMKEK